MKLQHCLILRQINQTICTVKKNIAVADKLTHRILGVQIIGPQGVDKRIDVFASTITLESLQKTYSTWT